LLPEEHLSYRPIGGQRTAGEHFLHIAQVEDYYARGLFDGDWKFERLKPVHQPLSREMLRHLLAALRGYTLEHVEQLTIEQLTVVMEVPGIPVTWPLRSWLWYLVEHEIHHKAQLALYLRHLGILPPFFAYAFPPGMRPDIF